MHEFYSSAKLILMGEYAVMHGADALCIPLKTGQTMKASLSGNGIIDWKWTYNDRILADFSLNAYDLSSAYHDSNPSDWIIAVIRAIRGQSPGFISQGAKLEFINYFPPTWGLGTSSATISSLCRWAGADPFVVNSEVTGGSGFDIAAATAKKWFLYRRSNPQPVAWEIPLTYPFAINTWFIYSGHKKNTASHISLIDTQNKQDESIWMAANDFVYRFLASKTLPELSKTVYDHELLISMATNQTLIGENFPDFPGVIKSLGAWGGDFFMCLTSQNDDFVKNYFSAKGYNIVLTWDQMTQTPFFRL